MDEALEAAGLSARLYIIKLPQDRSFSLTTLANHPPPDRLVARLLWEESLTKVFLLGFPNLKHDRNRKTFSFVVTPFIFFTSCFCLAFHAFVDLVDASKHNEHLISVQKRVKVQLSDSPDMVKPL